MAGRMNGTSLFMRSRSDVARRPPCLRLCLAEHTLILQKMNTDPISLSRAWAPHLVLVLGTFESVQPPAQRCFGVEEKLT